MRIFPLIKRWFPLLLALLVLADFSAAQRGGGGGRGGKQGGAARGGGKGRPSGKSKGGLGAPIAPAPLPPIPKIFPPLDGARPGLPTPLTPTGDKPLPDAGLGLDPDAITLAEGEYMIDPFDPVLEERYFQTCDHDANGWIAFREAHFSLQLSRRNWTHYDTDLDGRISREEFAETYARTLKQIGAFKPPKAAPSLDGATLASPNERSQLLLTSFDRDGDGSLQESEVDLLLAKGGQHEISLNTVMGAADSDGSGAVDSTEIAGLVQLLKLKGGLLTELTDSPGSEAAEDPAVDAPSWLSRPSTPRVARIAGPLSHFDRLDFDRDGYISSKDLTILQAPLQLRVRTNAVIAALDRDGDSRLNKAEFKGALE